VVGQRQAVAHVTVMNCPKGSHITDTHLLQPVFSDIHNSLLGIIQR
jgi:hypothetical protein